MAPTPLHRTIPRFLLALLAGAAFGVGPGVAFAQYKVVQPDGRVLYTDIPPVTSSARVTPLGRRAVAPASETTLPDALRRVAERYPVTLYTAADCDPCAKGRQLLMQRGVPYQERLIASNDDTLALDRITGARTVPALTIGSQPVHGFSAQEWAAYLDVAGYPRESSLPASWQPPPVRTLVERSAAPSTPPAAVRPAPNPTPETPSPAAAASGGIRF